MKVKEIAQSYLILKEAKITKMEDADKFKIIRAMREMRPVVEKYTNDEKEAIEKLEDEDYKSMLDKAEKHNDAIKEGDKSGILSHSELKELQDYFEKVQKSKNGCLKELQEEEKDINFEKISDEALSKLISSNDFTVGQILSLEMTLC